MYMYIVKFVSLMLWAYMYRVTTIFYRVAQGLGASGDYSKLF